MNVIFWIVIWILLFFFLVLIHEFWHFLAAKKSGVKVLEFWIGIPPKVCKLFSDKSGTKYTLNWLPFGWFVRLKWEDPENNTEFNAKDSLISAKIHKKIFIILAWVCMNLITAWLLFTFVFTIWTQPVSIIPDESTVASEAQSYLMPTYGFLKENWFIDPDLWPIPVLVSEVIENGLWEEIGLLSWDKILSLNNQEINPRNISLLLKQSIGQSIPITYQRWEDITTLQLDCPEDSCFLWILYNKRWIIDIKDIKFPLHKAMLISLKEIKAETIITLNALGKLGNDLFSFNSSKIKNSLNKLTGPAWVIKFGQLIIEYSGRIVFLAFAGMISLALAIFNVLPIPALDWGRLIGMLIQWIFRLKPEKYFKIEGYINIIFFIFLLALWIYILLKDLVFARNVNIPFIG